jgi:hypothetical protein
MQKCTDSDFDKFNKPLPTLKKKFDTIRKAGIAFCLPELANDGKPFFNSRANKGLFGMHDSAPLRALGIKVKNKKGKAIKEVENLINNKAKFVQL